MLQNSIPSLSGNWQLATGNWKLFQLANLAAADPSAKIAIAANHLRGNFRSGFNEIDEFEEIAEFSGASANPTFRVVNTR